MIFHILYHTKHFASKNFELFFCEKYSFKSLVIFNKESIYKCHIINQKMNLAKNFIY